MKPAEPPFECPILRMEGHMDVDTVKPFALEAHRTMRVQGSALVIDMSHLDDLTEGAMGALLLLQSEAQRRGGAIKLARVSEHILSELTLSAMTDVFEIFDSTDAAVRSFAANGGKRKGKGAQRSA